MKQKRRKQYRESKQRLVISDKQKRLNSSWTSQKKKKDTKILSIKNQRRDITMYTIGIKRIKVNFYKKLYANKFHNLGKMDKCHRRNR